MVSKVLNAITIIRPETPVRWQGAAPLGLGVLIALGGILGPCSALPPNIAHKFQTARQCGARTKSGQPCRFTSDEKGALSVARRCKR